MKTVYGGVYGGDRLLVSPPNSMSQVKLLIEAGVTSEMFLSLDGVQNLIETLQDYLDVQTAEKATE